MQETAKRNFILQQGFGEPPLGACPLQYSALHFQPRIVLIWVLAGILFQSAAIFAVLCVVLWWSALFPKLNPFEALYNRTLGTRPRALRLGAAPTPRRVSQAMAGTFALAAALLIYSGFRVAAYIVEGIFLAAVVALTIGGFCLGSFVYHLVGGHAKFARQTIPWAR